MFWAQPMKGGAHPDPFAALSSLKIINKKKHISHFAGDSPVQLALLTFVETAVFKFRAILVS